MSTPSAPERASELEQLLPRALLKRFLRARQLITGHVNFGPVLALVKSSQAESEPAVYSLSSLVGERSFLRRWWPLKNYVVSAAAQF